jgi:hypothetical protein
MANCRPAVAPAQPAVALPASSNVQASGEAGSLARAFYSVGFRRQGLQSAAARMEKMTPEQRKAIAKKAAAASAAVRSKKRANKGSKPDG